MFERIKEMFATYSCSSTYCPDVTLRSVHLQMGPGLAIDKIIDILKELKYKKIVTNDVYKEIFTSKAGFEVTIHVIADGDSGGSKIDIDVYSPQNRGKTAKALRYLLHTIKEKLG